jgi:hypothetical protein
VKRLIIINDEKKRRIIMRKKNEKKNLQLRHGPADVVKVHSLEWFQKMCTPWNDYGDLRYHGEPWMFTPEMYKYAGQEVTILRAWDSECYVISGSDCRFQDWMFEDENTGEEKDLKNLLWITRDQDGTLKAWTEKPAGGDGRYMNYYNPAGKSYVLPADILPEITYSSGPVLYRIEESEE